jgi:Protein of unknown function (DUF3352)
MPPGTPWAPGPGEPPGGRATRQKRRWPIVVLAAVLVVVVGGGGAFAFNLLSGGGTQPDEVLPGNAMGYVRVDLDPSAGQKVAMLDFARKFPELSKRIGSDNDVRKALFESAKAENKDLAKLDYAKDIEPWLGDRAGVAMLPPADGEKEPETAFALQVKDEKKARVGLEKLRDLSEGDKKDPSGIAFLNGYAILAESQGQADQYATAAKKSSLAKEKQFQDDFKSLGDDGVFSFWMHVGRLATVGAATQGVPDSATENLAAVENGRFAGAIRFDGQYVELASQTYGIKAPAVKNAAPVNAGNLPDSTVGLLSISGLGDGVGEAWPQLLDTAKKAGFDAQLQAYMSMAEDQYGLKLPADLQTILGKNLTIVADGKNIGEKQPMPEFGAKIVTDPKRAEEVFGVIQKAVSDSGEVELALQTATTSDSFIVATSKDYAETLAAGGKLGSSDAFKLAVPNADKATFALYADLDKLEPLYLNTVPKDQRGNVEVLRSVGISGTQSEDGNGTFTVRLVVK